MCINSYIEVLLFPYVHIHISLVERHIGCRCDECDMSRFLTNGFFFFFWILVLVETKYHNIFNFNIYKYIDYFFLICRPNIKFLFFLKFSLYIDFVDEIQNVALLFANNRNAFYVSDRKHNEKQLFSESLIWDSWEQKFQDLKKVLGERGFGNY